MICRHRDPRREVHVLHCDAQQQTEFPTPPTESLNRQPGLHTKLTGSVEHRRWTNSELTMIYWVCSVYLLVYCVCPEHQVHAAWYAWLPWPGALVALPVGLRSAGAWAARRPQRFGAPAGPANLPGIQVPPPRKSLRTALKGRSTAWHGSCIQAKPPGNRPTHAIGTADGRGRPARCAIERARLHSAQPPATCRTGARAADPPGLGTEGRPGRPAAAGGASRPTGARLHAGRLRRCPYGSPRVAAMGAMRGRSTASQSA